MRTVTDQMAGTRLDAGPVHHPGAVERQPGMSQNELAAIAEVALITVARLVDRPEAQGRRCTDPKAHLATAVDAGGRAGPARRQRYRAEVRELMTEGEHEGLENDDDGLARQRT